LTLHALRPTSYIHLNIPRPSVYQFAVSAISFLHGMVPWHRRYGNWGYLGWVRGTAVAFSSSFLQQDLRRSSLLLLRRALFAVAALDSLFAQDFACCHEPEQPPLASLITETTALLTLRPSILPMRAYLALAQLSSASSSQGLPYSPSVARVGPGGARAGGASARARC
jgi:hypothetical protein